MPSMVFYMTVIPRTQCNELMAIQCFDYSKCLHYIELDNRVPCNFVPFQFHNNARLRFLEI